MLDLVACYGRKRPQASGDPRVAELLSRSVDGQYKAMASFDSTLAGIVTRGLVPWNATITELTLLNYQWLARLAWERATVFLDAFVTGGVLDDIAYKQVDLLCDQASRATIKMIALQVEITQGRQPGLKLPGDLPNVPVTAANVHAVWSSFETVFSRLEADLDQLARLGVPPRMHKVHHQVIDAFQPKEHVFRYLRKQWYGTTDMNNRRQYVRDALPLAQHFFLLGQQLWTPYMLGPTYTNIIRSTALFDRLGLGFDPWLMSDPAQVDSRVTDAASCRELAKFWESVSDPASAKALQDQIDLMTSGGLASIHQGKTYKMAPWHPQYEVHAVLTVGHLSLEAGDLFAIYPRGTHGGKRLLELRRTGHV